LLLASRQIVSGLSQNRSRHPAWSLDETGCRAINDRSQLV